MKVMIAEDEFYSRKMLVKMLQELDFEIEICLEAETGKQAADYLTKAAVDLVITDIRMPEMDGLELAEYAAEHCPETRVIIVSGYADFSYAQKAIQYGVQDYLTKPVKLGELEHSIGKLIKETSEKQKRISQESLQYLGIPGIMESTVLQEAFRLQCGDHFEKSPYRLFLFQGNDFVYYDNMLAFCSRLERLRGSYQAYPFCFLQQQEVVLLLFDEQENLEKNKILLMIESLLKETAVNCGCSRTYRELKELGEAYKDSIYAINRRLLLKDTRLFEYEAELNLHQLLSKQEEMLLYEYVLKCNYGQAEAIVRRFLDQCENEGRDVYSLYSGIMQIFSIVSRAFCQRDASETFDEEDRYLLFSFKSDLYQFKSMDELKSYILNILKNTCKSQEENGDNKIIEEIKEYVARNYRYDITLNELACHKYFMNPSYLSRLFKAETGMNFTKYLIAYRMERAKELLLYTEIKINEIADCVGYNDTSYFIHTFRKSYHMTPEQFRTKGEKK